MTTYRQTSMNLTPATEAQLDYLKAKGFGGTTDIVRIAIDRMATQEGMNTMDPKTAIKELMQKYDEKRQQWIERFGSDEGFDKWFTQQVIGR